METFKIHTLGCKVNQYETQLMREQLQKAGLKEVHPHTKIFGVGVNSNTPVDLYIVNTCTVTSDTDRECRRLIRRCMKENPNAKIIAAGCYTEKDADKIKAIDENIIILKNEEKKDILNVIPVRSPRRGKTGIHNQILDPRFRGDDNHENSVAVHNHITRFHGRTRAFIKIQDGCDNYCSYCKVPYVRGKPKSRNIEEIVAEAKALIKNNYKEMVLTGICLGSYGKDNGSNISLVDVLSRIASLGGDFRIRLSSIEIQDVTDELIHIIKLHNKICDHLHIPLQSGDDSILKSMNRKYTQHVFVTRINQLKEAIPGIAISTDVIIGFPGEDEHAFNSTVKVLKTIKPMRTHLFTYSKREGTKAAAFVHGISKAKRAERYSLLKILSDNLSRAYYNYTMSRKQRVLVESTRDKQTNRLRGYTDTYITLIYEGPDTQMGEFVYYPFTPPSIPPLH